MNADKIRKILNAEVISLENSVNLKAANALRDFSNWATDQQLVSFRQIISGLSPAELNDAARGQ